MPLFEVAIIEKPTINEFEAGKPERLVFGPTAVISPDEKSAALAAVLQAGTGVDVDRSRMEVLVRPFAKPR